MKTPPFCGGALCGGRLPAGFSAPFRGLPDQLLHLGEVVIRLQHLVAQVLEGLGEPEGPMSARAGIVSVASAEDKICPPNVPHVLGISLDLAVGITAGVRSGAEIFDFHGCLQKSEWKVN